jgi:glycosyltransferase involved in cell wall biosynthesis
VEPVLVNGRYSGRPVTGVERVASEIVRHLRVDHRLVGSCWGRGARGHAAEQVLPAVLSDVRRGLLWSPANVGPLLHLRHVVTIHDVATIRHPEFFSRAFRAVYPPLLRRLARTATAIVTPSEFTARELVDLGLTTPDKIVVIRNGIDGLRPDPEEASSGSDVVVPVVYRLPVGSMDPRKSLDRLVCAYEQASRRGALPPLLVVGGSSAVFADAGRPLPDGVRHLGRVSDAVLARLYAGARGVVNVSVYEGFGLTVAEAARSGAALLVSDIPAHRELLPGDSSVLWVDPEETSEIADGLVRLSRADGGPHELSGHTWAAAGERYGELFDSLRRSA